MAVLLEELPLQHLGAQAWLGGQKLAAIGQEVENGIGLPQVAAVFQLQHRHLAVGVHRQELGRFGLALEDVHRVPFVWPAQQAQHQLDLVTVARLVVAIDLVHRPSTPKQFCICAQ
ncbi:hypothetical protein D3C78_1570300 [compost metagenome]